MAVAGKAAKHTMPRGQMATHNSLTGNGEGGGAKGHGGELMWYHFLSRQMKEMT